MPGPSGEMSRVAELTTLPPKEEISLEDKVRVLQKYGGCLTDEQIAEHLELEDRRARHAIENEKRIEQAAAEQIRIEAEKRKIARDEMGKRIIVSLNKTRIKGLNADGSVPCPACGECLPAATGALLEVADLFRGAGDLYGLIGRMYVGAKPSGIPCIYTGATCPHCGTGVTVLVQMVI